MLFILVTVEGCGACTQAKGDSIIKPKANGSNGWMMTYPIISNILKNNNKLLHINYPGMGRHLTQQIMYFSLFEMNDKKEIVQTLNQRVNDGTVSKVFVCTETTSKEERKITHPDRWFDYLAKNISDDFQKFIPSAYPSVSVCDWDDWKKSINFMNKKQKDCIFYNSFTETCEEDGKFFISGLFRRNVNMFQFVSGVLDGSIKLEPRKINSEDKVKQHEYEIKRLEIEINKIREGINNAKITITRYNSQKIHHQKEIETLKPKKEKKYQKLKHKKDA